MPGPVEVLVLGPVGLRRDGETHSPTGVTRAVLAALALAGETGLTADALFAQVWGARGAQSMKSTLTVTVHRLRQWLRDAGGDGIAVRATTTGYALTGGRVDAALFRALVAEAAGLPPAAAAESLGRALALWRGPALADVPPDSVDQARCAGLERDRVTAVTAYATALIATGQADTAVRVLAPVVEAESLDETVVAVWIEALASVGRQAAALEAYEQVRLRLRDELGVDPSRALSHTLVRVLRQELSPSAAVDPVAVPAQLPADVAVFTGRAAQLTALDRLADGAAHAAVISAIAGAGGVGKTTLAVHWAHRALDRFPDGQLYVDLRGYAQAPPLSPVEALGRLLRGLGVPGENVPVEEDEAAALYRSVLARRRVLVLLDNAASAAQVRPLLPGSGRCLALVTSRDRLDGLVVHEGASRVGLDVLTPAESVELLGRILGADRVAAEPAAAAGLAEACAHLPLALRLVAAHLLNRPDLRLADQVATLRGGDPLSRLGGDSVRATFDLSYARLPDDVRRMFRLLGLAPGAELSLPAAAALAELPVSAADRLLDQLVAAHLVSVVGASRYGLHDLLRAYAAERARREYGEADRAAALDRLYDWYLAGAIVAADMLDARSNMLPPRPVDPRFPVPGFETAGAARDWLRLELHQLLAAAAQAGERGTHPLPWYLSHVLRHHLRSEGELVAWLRLGDAGLEAARRDRDPTGLAAVSHSLACAYRVLGEQKQALELDTRALEYSREAGWRIGEGTALGNLGITYAYWGDLDRSAECISAALEINRQVGEQRTIAINSQNLGVLYAYAGRLADSVEQLRVAVAEHAKLGAPAQSAHVLDNLANSLLLLGRTGEAEETVRQAVALSRDSGNAHHLGMTLATLAKVLLARGEDAAADAAAEALALADKLGDVLNQSEAGSVVAQVRLALGDTARALAGFTRALGQAQRINQPQPEIVALLGLAATHRRLGDPEAAIGLAQRALARAHEGGYRIQESDALTTLAESYAAAGRPDRARAHAEQALAVQRETGYRAGERQAARVLGGLAGEC